MTGSRAPSGSDDWAAPCANCSGRSLPPVLRLRSQAATLPSQTIKAYVARGGRSPGEVTFGHGNWVRLVDAKDRNDALRLQRPFYERMGTHRSLEHLERCYFMGTTGEIVERIEDLRQAGLEYPVVGLLDYDLEQLDRWATDVIPRFA